MIIPCIMDRPMIIPCIMDRPMIIPCHAILISNYNYLYTTSTVIWALPRNHILFTYMLTILLFYIIRRYYLCYFLQSIKQIHHDLNQWIIMYRSYAKCWTSQLSLPYRYCEVNNFVRHIKYESWEWPRHLYVFICLNRFTQQIIIWMINSYPDLNTMIKGFFI